MKTIYPIQKQKATHLTQTKRSELITILVIYDGLVSTDTQSNRQTDTNYFPIDFNKEGALLSGKKKISFSGNKAIKLKKPTRNTKI